MRHMRFVSLLLVLPFLIAPVTVASETDCAIAESVLVCLAEQENPRRPQSPAESDLIRKLSRQQNTNGSFGPTLHEHITSVIALELTDPYAYDRDSALIYLCKHSDISDPELMAYSLSALQFFRGDRIAEAMIETVVANLRKSVENAAAFPCQTLSAVICGLTAVGTDLSEPHYVPLVEAFTEYPQDTLEAKRAVYALQTGVCPYWAIARNCQTPETIFSDTINSAEAGVAMVTLYNKGVIVGRPSRNAAASEPLTAAELLVMLDRMLPEDRPDSNSGFWYSAALERFSSILSIDPAKFDPYAVLSAEGFSAITEVILLPKYKDVGLPGNINTADPTVVTRGEAAIYLAAVLNLTVKP